MSNFMGQGGQNYQGQGGMNVMGQRLSQFMPKPAPPPPPMPMTIRPPQAMSQVPQQGFGGPPGGMSMAEILNGPMFGQPPQGGMPQAPQGGMMPSPQVPQQNFQQFGRDQMAQILAQQGG